jgi:hypothetical protein
LRTWHLKSKLAQIGSPEPTLSTPGPPGLHIPVREAWLDGSRGFAFGQTL